MAAYPSLASYYGANHVRFLSRERQIGMFWRSSGRAGRLAWIQETGELILVHHGVNAARQAGLVEVLAVICAERELDHVIDGWEYYCGRRGSLDWLEARLRERTRTSARSRSPDLPEAS